MTRASWTRRDAQPFTLTHADEAELLAFFAARLALAPLGLSWLRAHGVAQHGRLGVFDFLACDAPPASRGGSRALRTVGLLIGDGLFWLCGDDPDDARRIGEAVAKRVGLPRTVAGETRLVNGALDGLGVPSHQPGRAAVPAAPGTIERYQAQRVYRLDRAHAARALAQPRPAATTAPAARAHGSALGPLRDAGPDDVIDVWEATISRYTEETGLRVRDVERRGFGQLTRQKTIEGRLWVQRTTADTLVFKASTSIPAPDIVHLEGIYVAPTHRRRGIARDAVRSLCAHLLCRSSLVTLTVNESNVGAIRLYEALGFVDAHSYATVFIAEAPRAEQTPR